MGTQRSKAHPLLKPIAATALVFFVVEVAVMHALSALPLGLPGRYAPLVDAALLVLLGVPLLWLFVVRPFYVAAIGHGQKWENLLEAAPEGIVGVGRDGRIRFANKYSGTVFGYAPDDLVGVAIEQLIPERYTRHHVALRERFFDAPGPRPMGAGREVYGRRRDGSEFPAHVSLNLIRAGAEPIVLTIVRDVSEQKRIEHELRSANDRLVLGMEEVRKNAEVLRFLMEFGAYLQRCATEAELYDVVGRHMQRLFPDRSGALFVLAPARDLLEVVSSWGGSGAPESFAPDACWGVRRGQVHDSASAGCAMPCSHLPKNEDSAMCVPLVAQEGVLGMLHFGDAAPARCTPAIPAVALPGAAREHLFMLASEQVATALVNLRLRAALHEQSIRDPLTRLYNRRHFDRTLEREIERGRRSQAPLAIVMLDIDHFKRINDRYGHDGGDEVLKAVAHTLVSEVRTADVACRIGGEEFCIIAPDTTLDAAGQLAARLHYCMKELELEVRGRPLGPVNASFGVAQYPLQGDDAKSLVKAADHALYEAKEAGRDRVVLAFATAA